MCALAALCIRLGLWQWHRMEQKQADAATMAERLAADPVPLNGTPQDWTRVRVTGRFLTDRQVTVKFMVRDGRPGVNVVTPLVRPGGTAVLVDRGWMPSANDDEPPAGIPAPPRGTVTIEGWWRPDSRADAKAVAPAAGQVRAISSAALREHVGRPLVPGYVNQQQPTTDGLEPEPRPQRGSALNFFYALQWWFFAALVVIGVPWLGLSEHRREMGH